MKVDLFAPESTRAVRSRPFEWVVDPLLEEPSFVVRPMFGAYGCYLHGRLVVVLCGRREEPWHGVLVPTEREHHRSLLRQFPALTPHEVLGKWLYLSAATDAFEPTAHALVERIRRDDDRIGVEPRANGVKRAPPSRRRKKRRRG
jgi:hypothetical protein